MCGSGIIRAENFILLYMASCDLFYRSKTVRVLNVSKTTVIKTLKGKEACLVQVNPNIKTMKLSADSEISLKLACDAAEIDEQ